MPPPVGAGSVRRGSRCCSVPRIIRTSGGAFDITYASVGHLYDYRESIRPTDAAMEQARARSAGA